MGVEVSMLFVEGHEINAQGLELLQARSRYETGRAKRSNRATITTSNFLALASAISLSSAGRPILRARDAFIAVLPNGESPPFGVFLECEGRRVGGLSVSLGGNPHIKAPRRAGVREWMLRVIERWIRVQ
jgi:hypothetical protein